MGGRQLEGGIDVLRRLLLVRVGYFDKSKRFWTTDEFPGAEEVRQKIVEYIKKHMESGGTGGEYYQSALEQLGAE